MVNPQWANAQASAYNAGNLPKVSAIHAGASGGVPVYAKGDDPDYVPPLYTKTPDGIAHIGLRGAMTKGASSFGGTSNIRVRKAMRTAEADGDVGGIMLAIDSPGGTVAGHKAMADEIRRIAKAGLKPVHTYVEDSMHSAALWSGVQANRVSAAPMAQIGSIGVMVAIHDYSEKFKEDGIKVNLISTGDQKGAFTPGTEITEEMLATVQARVDELNGFFVDAVKQGRGMTAKAVKALATGEDWMAAKAVELGLVDAVETDDQAIEVLRREIKAGQRRRDQEARARNGRIRAASL